MDARKRGIEEWAQHISELSSFYEKIFNDPRISGLHIALYITLRWIWKANGCPQKFRIFKRDIMPLAKISSTATYVKAMRGLEEYGLITYIRSHDRTKGSQITFT